METMQTIWGWQPALYLFLGGVGAGAFIAAGVLVLTDREGSRSVAGASMWAALGCLGVGLLLLLSELTNPARGLLLWQSFSNGSSWMAFGAWAALLALVAFAASALLVTRTTHAFALKRWPGFAARERAVCTVLVCAGMALAACVAVYTGMLLMSVPGVPFWNTLLLPCLFTVSALDTGVALVEAVSVVLAKREELGSRSRRLLEGSVVALVALEGAVLLLFVQTMLAGNVTSAWSLGSPAAAATMSAQMLTTGSLAPVFWGLLVACGLAVPLAAALVGLVVGRRQEKPSAAVHAITAVGAIGALAGGCALRFLVLLAGVHADLVADSVMRLFS